MGSWGSGLYSGDFALDLRAAIRAVARLPFDADRLTQIVCDVEAAAAVNPDNEDHTTFWLVLADQFARRGIASSRATAMALQIIDSGQDLEMQRQLGQSAGGLEKRRRQLAEVRERIVSAVVVRSAWSAVPDLNVLRAAEWLLASAGTCSPVHFRRMRIEKIGSFVIDAAKLRALFPTLRPGDSQAVSDISIANRMDVSPEGPPRPILQSGPYRRVIRIDDLISDTVRSPAP